MSEVFRPKTQSEVAARLGQCSEAGARFPELDRSGLNRLVEYAPEDMTATVEAGMTLEEFRTILREHKQWLPIDPGGDGVSIGEILDENLYGPRRLGYGTVRDYLIGIRVALPSGELIKAGGKVVKNVAGYDLCKLFIGARQTLGVIVEGTFKVLPIPEATGCLRFEGREMKEVAERVAMILAGNLRPVVVDAMRSEPGGAVQLVVIFEGSKEEVEVQCQTLRGYGFREPGGEEIKPAGSFAVKSSVLPSRCCEYLDQLKGRWQAHLGNGIILHNEELSIGSQKSAGFLGARLKQTFDPRNILPQHGA